MPATLLTTTTFATVFITLFTGHHVGDYWVQRHHHAMTKGNPGRAGRWACTQHVISLTITKALLLLLAGLALDLRLSAAGLITGFAADATSHWWADRRTTLAHLARLTGKSDFLKVGTPDHPNHPVDAEGKYAPTTGTGLHNLDQSFHIFWLFISSLIIAAL